MGSIWDRYKFVFTDLLYNSLFSKASDGYSVHYRVSLKMSPSPVWHGNSPTCCFQMLRHGDLTPFDLESTIRPPQSSSEKHVLMIWFVLSKGPLCTTWPVHTYVHTHTLYSYWNRNRIRINNMLQYHCFKETFHITFHFCSVGLIQHFKSFTKM